MLNRRDLDMAATLLVLAAALALKPVIESLLDVVMQSVTIQVQVGLRPSLTMEQIVVLHRLHPDVTDHLVQRIAYFCIKLDWRGWNSAETSTTWG
jgi:hypothetical protein